MKKIFCLVVASLLLASLVAKAEVAGFKEGKWEIVSMLDKVSEVKLQVNQQGGKTTVITNGGIPTLGDQVAVNDECITSTVPVPGLKDLVKQYSGCVPPQVQLNNGSVDYELSCVSPQSTVDVRWHLVYTGNSLTGQVSTNLVNAGKVSSRAEHITGKFMGPC